MKANISRSLIYLLPLVLFYGCTSIGPGGLNPEAGLSLAGENVLPDPASKAEVAAPELETSSYFASPEAGGARLSSPLPLPDPGAALIQKKLNPQIFLPDPPLPKRNISQHTFEPDLMLASPTVPKLLAQPEAPGQDHELAGAGNSPAGPELGEAEGLALPGEVIAIFSNPSQSPALAIVKEEIQAPQTSASRSSRSSSPEPQISLPDSPRSPALEEQAPESGAAGEAVLASLASSSFHNPVAESRAEPVYLQGSRGHSFVIEINGFGWEPQSLILPDGTRINAEDAGDYGLLISRDFAPLGMRFSINASGQTPDTLRMNFRRTSVQTGLAEDRDYILFWNEDAGLAGTSTAGPGQEIVQDRLQETVQDRGQDRVQNRDQNSQTALKLDEESPLGIVAAVSPSLPESQDTTLAARSPQALEAGLGRNEMSAEPGRLTPDLTQDRLLFVQAHEAAATRSAAGIRQALGLYRQLLSQYPLSDHYFDAVNRIRELERHYVMVR